MAKTKVSEFDAVASNNTDINSVNVAEGCPPSGINNAIREMASLLKKQEVGTDAMTSPDINGGTIDGATIGGSSGVTIGVSDGTVSAPSIKFTSDTNTGIYRGGTDILKFVTAGTDAVTIDANQNVDLTGDLTIGSGTGGGNVPSGHELVFGANNSDITFLSDSASASVDGTIGAWNTVYNFQNSKIVFDKPSANTGQLQFFTNAGSGITERMQIANNGDISFYEDTGTTPKFFWDASEERLGIGTASPDNNLHILGSNGLRIVNSDNTTNLAILGFDNNESSVLNLYSNSTIQAKIHSEGVTYFNGGNVGIGTSSPDYNLQVEDTSSNISLALTSSTGGFSRVIFGDSGSATIGAVTYRNSENSMAFEANGAEAMRIDSSGRVMIGTTTEGDGGADDLTIATTGNTGITIRSGTIHNGGIYFSDGTSGNDQYRGYIDYDHNGDNLNFATDAVERMRIDSSGRVGIGTSSPDGLLTLATANSSTPTLRLQHPTNNADATIDTSYDGSGTYLTIGTNVYQSGFTLTKFDSAKPACLTYYDASGFILFYNGAAGSSIEERMRLTTSGNLLVGTGSAVNGATRAGFFNDASANQVVSVYNANNTSGDSVFNTLIGSNCNNTSSFHIVCGVNGVANVFYVYGNGNVVNTNNSYGAISDIKLKENIINASSQWDDIKSLQIRKYSLKSDNLDTPNMLGVIAQELETAGMGGLVFEVPDRDENNNELETTTKNVNYSILYMKAVKALQEAMTRIETLETAKTDLEARIVALETA